MTCPVGPELRLLRLACEPRTFANGPGWLLRWSARSVSCYWRPGRASCGRATPPKSPVGSLFRYPGRSPSGVVGDGELLRWEVDRLVSTDCSAFRPSGTCPGSPVASSAYKIMPSQASRPSRELSMCIFVGESHEGSNSSTSLLSGGLLSEGLTVTD